MNLVTGRPPPCCNSVSPPSSSGDISRVPPPPLRPPPEDHDEDNSERYHDSFADMETPLVGHTSTKKVYTKRDVFRSQLQACYSSVSENGRSTSDDCDTNDGTDNGDGSDMDDERSVSTFSTASGVVTLTTTMENFRDHLLLPFTDEQGSLPSVVRGLAALMVVGAVMGVILPKNNRLHGKWPHWYRYVSSIIGYSYFVIWSVCFYPQVLLNYRRKSTKGLSNDFAVLNFLGWAFYSAYLCSMLFDDNIKTMYKQRFAIEASTVASNDVAFAVHATLLSVVYLLQILYYANSWTVHLKAQTWMMLVGMVVPSVLVPILIVSGFLSYQRWLDYFYVLSFFKIGCTLTKYTKQVFLNWNRQSTKGWNIWYNFLECLGGSLSMVQIVLDSIDMRDLTGITGNLAKFALGLITIFFDAIFFTQHYVLYPDAHTTDQDKSGSIKASHRFEVLCLEPEEVRSLDAAVDVYEELDEVDSTDF